MPKSKKKEQEQPVMEEVSLDDLNVMDPGASKEETSVEEDDELDDIED